MDNLESKFQFKRSKEGSNKDLLSQKKPEDKDKNGSNNKSRKSDKSNA